jgi:hypothetical protein
MKLNMSHRQAALKIKHWYLMQMHILEIAVKGKERFTLFEKMAPEQRSRILERVSLNPSEMPVLILTISPDHYIINTTERFLNISPKDQESVYYDEFYDFENFTALRRTKKKHDRRVDPTALTELGLKKTSGDIIFWEVPTGNIAYYFWNITRLVSMIRIEKHPPSIITI